MNKLANFVNSKAVYLRKLTNKQINATIIFMK